MAARFVDVDRDTPLLLPVDLRDWVDDDDMVHLVVACVNAVPMRDFVVNERGTGDRQYPPRMMLALLVYCYAHGTFSSRRIERATYRDIAVRYLTADTHPDHDTICTFRRRNMAAVGSAFLQVLRLAREMGVLKVGTVSLDGTRMAANASKHRNVQYARAGSLIDTLQAQIQELLAAAETADTTNDGADESLPDALRKREALQEKLHAARRRLEQEALKKAVAESRETKQKEHDRDQRPPSRKGPKIKPPVTQPKPTDSTNLTDPDSGIMRQSKRHAYLQAYNAQLVVDADGSQLILGSHVSRQAADACNLIPTLEAMPDELGSPQAVLADSGYCSEANHDHLASQGILPIIATPQHGKKHRELDLRPPPKPPYKRAIGPFHQSQNEQLKRPKISALYRLRQQTVEPVFGIIREVLGFRRFHLRGHAKVTGEWTLVSLAYNLKRLATLLPSTA